MYALPSLNIKLKQKSYIWLLPKDNNFIVQYVGDVSQSHTT